jgi:L-Ala-D/L-Glu epimerase
MVVRSTQKDAVRSTRGDSVKIVRLEAIPYRLPMNGSLQWGAHSKLSVAEHVLVRVHLENGVFGEAEAPPRPTIYGETVSSIRGILDHLSPVLVGLEVEDRTGIASALGSVPNNNTAKGALDMACWDARTKSSGPGLFAQLAGPNRDLRVSYILGNSDPATMLEEARRVFAAGVRVLKVKVGRNHEKDLAVIRDLNLEFAGEMQLYADSNETLTPETAPKALEAMRDAGLMYVEEPLPVRQIKARAELKRLNILPIIADDSTFTPADLEREIDFDTFEILNIKTARTGFTQSLRMLELAKNAGKGVMLGSQASTTLGTAHAALIASQVGVTEPSELSFFLKLEGEITNKNLKLENGILRLEQIQDVQVDAARLEAHRMQMVGTN